MSKRSKFFKAIIFSMTMMRGITSVNVQAATSNDKHNYSSTDKTSLKDTYSKTFGEVGSAATIAQLEDSNTLDFIKKHYNSITMENETKPDALLGSTAKKIKVSEAKKKGLIIPEGYSEKYVPNIDFTNIDKVLKIASKNKLDVRFQTLIWHNQTPAWFFKEGYEGENNYVDPATMDKRVEYYVKNVMNHVYSSKYGKVVYAWDIANEYLHNTDSGECKWTQIYGDEGLKPAYIKKAFTYANEMLARHKKTNKVKLFYNDYNTYLEADNIVEMISYINSDKKICDGIGMQTHLDVDWPDASFIGQAIDKFKNAGLEIQLTEIDATINYREDKYTLKDQANYYFDLMKMLIDKKQNGANITGITFWGLYDEMSWRKDGKPLLFVDMNTPKEAYYAVIKAADPEIKSYKSWQYEKLDTSWIDPSKPMIAFAFDDGPVSSKSGTSGMRILKTLEKYKQHATFFYWGNKITDSNKNEIKYAAKIGCEIGNHTWTHTPLTDLDENQINAELEQCRTKLQEITGISSFLLRPPYLAIDDKVKNTVNVPMVTCSVDSRDWDNGTYSSIVDRLMTAKDGDIILMHETYDVTALAVEHMVPYLLDKGYQIVSVSELAAMKGYDLQQGEVYSAIR